MFLNIQLKDRDAVLRLSNEACKHDDDIYVHTMDDMIMIDAKSLLALFSLVGKTCRLVAEDDFDPEVLAKIAKRAGVAL